MLLLKLPPGSRARGPERTEGTGAVLASLDGDYGKGKWCPTAMLRNAWDVTGSAN